MTRPQANPQVVDDVLHQLLAPGHHAVVATGGFPPRCDQCPQCDRETREEAAAEAE